MAVLEFSDEKNITVIMDEETPSGVRKIWKKVEKDILDTTGASCRMRMGRETCAQAVIITMADQPLASELGKIWPEFSALKGKWEAYAFYLLERPMEGVETALVIAGSDLLGAIYGMFYLSELLGVTAWGFWGDVTPPFHGKTVLLSETQKKRPGAHAVYIKNAVSKEPSVKYRGFFINDEWPCFGSWAETHYQGFTAQMYEPVFEYLLRMKGNYLWPAMWSSSFLLDGPGLASIELATEYGIYIGMSHHEPCMRSGEEFSVFRGEEYGTQWDYAQNAPGLRKFWADGLERVRGKRIFPTIGMRGERDSKLLGEDATVEENVRQLKRILKDQRALVARHTDCGNGPVPLLFAIYKEVEDYYFGNGAQQGIRGCEELQDVLLLFCEDNYGNMRALPQEAHGGGFGMYYHLDYHGAPVSYEWINSTPVTRIWEQMTQAYEYGVRDLWIVNVGDVKFQEYPLGYFMELAYDFERLGSGHYQRTLEYTKEWIRRLFGGRLQTAQIDRIAWVLEESVRLHSYRRAESCSDTVYHPAHYREGARMLRRARELEQKNMQILEELADSPCRDGYFSMIYYPAAAVANLLKMHLYAGMNHLYAAQGKAAANLYGEKLQACIEEDRRLAEQMAAFQNKKWAGMEKAAHIGFVNWNEEDWRYPVRHLVTLPDHPRLVVSRADDTKSYTNQYFPTPLVIDDFIHTDTSGVTLQIANGGSGTLRWKIPQRCGYLHFSAYDGSTQFQDEVTITADWEKAGEAMREFAFSIETESESVPVLVRVRRQRQEEVPDGVFFMQDGICVMDAKDCCERTAGIYAGQTASFEILNDYGKFGAGIKVFPNTAAFRETDDAPQAAYEFWAREGGDAFLELHTSPCNPLIYGGSLSMGVSVNGEKQKTAAVTDEHYRGGDPSCRAWADAVLNQEHVCTLPIQIKEGKNRLCIFAREAGIVLERLIVYTARKKPQKSYFGPPESARAGRKKP